MITTASGLQYEDTIAGTGADARRPASTSRVHYTGWLLRPGGANGAAEVRSAARTAATRSSFDLGAGQVIRGWDEGVQGMKVGGTRVLRDPAGARLRRARRRRRDPAERDAGVRGRAARGVAAPARGSSQMCKIVAISSKH